VGWGKAEPTLENMLGPLVAHGVIPRNIAVHLRTIQANASPGSHFQTDPLSDAHTYAAAGSYRVTVSVIDQGGGTASQTVRDDNTLAFFDYGFSNFRIDELVKVGHIVARPSVCERPGFRAAVNDAAGSSSRAVTTRGAPPCASRSASPE